MKQITELKNWNFEIRNLGYKAEITLPHTWNVDNNEEVQLYRGKAEYSTTVNIDANKKNVLYFGAVYHTAEIFVGGKFAGSHSRSGYTPFEIDITPFVVNGENTIKVIADNTPSEKMLPHEKDFDWADDGGITRAVKLIATEKSDIEDISISYIITNITKDKCSGTLNIDIKSEPQNFTVSLTEKTTGECIIKKDVFCDKKITLDFTNIKLWDNKNPNLYIVKVKGESDTAEKRTGFRTIEVKGAKVLLNGKEIYMKGCEWMPGSHPDYGMAEPFFHSEKCLSQLKDSGCVFTRFHWQQDDSIFDWCDENGLLVQEEIPYWGYPKEATPLQLEIAKQHADEMVHYHSHHPSIICWGVGNELGGEFQPTINYVKDIYAYFKSIDNSRLVNYVSNSVCRDADVNLDDATMYGDIAMWNEYLGLWQPCDDIEGVIVRTYNKFGEKPSMITEFGLCEPHFEGGDKKRAEILLQRIPMYKKLPNMVGYVWFSLNDYRTHCGEQGEGKMKQRVHGSTDLYGNKKPSYKIFSEID